MSPFSKKSVRRRPRGRRRTGPSRKTVGLVLDRAQHSCEICSAMIGDRRGMDWSLHHRLPRGAGGTRWPGINCPSNLLIVCGSATTGCHSVIEVHRTAAYAAGWLVRRGSDPAAVAVLLDRATRLVYLSADGRYSDRPAGRATTMPAPVDMSGHASTQDHRFPDTPGDMSGQDGGR